MSAPVCPRCAGTRFFHVTHVVERGLDPRGAATMWTTRAVGVLRSDVPTRVFSMGQRRLRGEHVEPVGHFETLVCRRCGHTTWLAMDWAALSSPTRMAACRRCEAPTKHAQREAIEGGGLGYEPVRLTHGMVGSEGFVDLDLCTACGLTTWRARDYLHVTDRPGTHRYTDDGTTRCLECAATRALVVESVKEHDGARVVVALHHEKVLRFFTLDVSEGRFSQRVCTSCHAIEWTAQRLDEIDIDPAQGIFAIGDAPAMSAEGPYR